MKTMEDLYKLDKKYRTEPFVMTKEDEEKVDKIVQILEGMRIVRSAEVGKHVRVEEVRK